MAPTFVTYSFLENSEVPRRIAAGDFANDGFFAMSAAQRADFRLALRVLEQVCGIRMVELATPENASLRIMNTDGSDWAGWSNIAWPGATVDLVIDGERGYGPGTPWFEVILHELGHAMGLKHPFEGDLTLFTDEDNQNNTLMSYTSNNRFDRAYAPFDIEALQSLYGSSPRVSADWRYGWSAGKEQFFLIGSADADRAVAPLLDSVLYGGAGNDQLYANFSVDALSFGNVTLDGGSGNDILRGGWSGTFRLYGGDGVDNLTTSGRSDQVFGGAGNDLIAMQDTSNSTIFGGDGNDTLYLRGLSYGLADGGSGRDILIAQDYNVVSMVRLGHVRFFVLVRDVESLTLSAGGSLYGNAVANALVGGSSEDELFGGAGDDLLTGLAGNDWLDGGIGADRLFGGAGIDVLIGRGGGDVLAGGSEGDVFRLEPTRGAAYRIEDFQPGIDKVRIEDDQPTFLSDFTVTEVGANLLITRPAEAGFAGLRLYLVNTDASEFTQFDLQ